MNKINQMYSRGRDTATTASSKNPNRVLGGLRGQGVDHYSILGKDNIERSVPTQKYVQGLEQKINEQDARIINLEKKIRSVNNDQKLTSAAVRLLNRTA
jgi:hypothetical protein